ncbi:hypothetical protein PVAND_008822 [Polypedilum vanderplanki]|uniref:Uncharacterized protein n=1 Tax=Polypedilum vanderplanki TaxID=319348 RepID=A0A9J6CB07_POLVA|nr:hypothetical protein PVAND_008822 [Polypedilum vanderplanki]
MATLARTEVLEQKIEKQIREHALTMKNLKNELQILKGKPKAQKDQRPNNDAMKKLGQNENVRKCPAKSLKKVPVDDKSTISNNHNNFTAGDKMTNKMIVQNHPHADEHVTMNGGSTLRTESILTSHTTSTSVVPESVMTRINYNGNIISSPVSPIKLLEFLIFDFRTKLKDYVSEDDEVIDKAFNEIIYTIKRAKLERRLIKVSSQISQHKCHLISTSTQTAVDKESIEKLIDFGSKQSLMQSELDLNLKRMEEIFTNELKKSDDKITKLSEDINLLQQKLYNGIDDKNTTMSHHIDLKMEEIKGEMKFLLRMIEETKNHNLIDNFNKKLAQTQKKIDEVKRKCTETAKNCLQMHVENHLSQNRKLQTKQMECELGHIKSVVDRNIRELKNVLTHTQSLMLPESKSTASLYSTNLSQLEDFNAESIISSSSIKLNENFHHRETKNCCVDKFNNISIIDDYDDDSEKDNDLMAKDETSVASAIITLQRQ